MKKMITAKRLTMVCVAVLAMLASTGLKAQNADKPELVIPLTDPGKPYKLNVSLVNGSITVSTYEGKTINIEVSNDEKKVLTERSDGMRRLVPANNSEVRATVVNNEVTIGGNQGKKSNLQIKIPQGQVGLKLKTINEGNITVNNVNGELEITNVNGGIKVNGASGSVVANTVNGNIKVDFKSIDPKAPMAFTTLNGVVDVSFPASLKFNVKMRSDRGEIYTDFDVVTEQRKPVVTNENKAASGMYSLKIDDWVYGKIGGGGPELLMKTMNGNIYVRKAK